MRLSFDSIEEVKEFVKQLKGSRTKDKDEDGGAQAGSAPAPLQPPNPGAGTGFPGAPGGFAPPVGSATPGAFPAAGAPAGPAPEVLALIQRISTRIDGAIASGQPAEAARTWLVGQCGTETMGYSMDQLKTIAMPKLTVAALENIAKLMGA